MHMQFRADALHMFSFTENFHNEDIFCGCCLPGWSIHRDVWVNKTGWVQFLRFGNLFIATSYNLGIDHNVWIFICCSFYKQLISAETTSLSSLLLTEHKKQHQLRSRSVYVIKTCLVTSTYREGCISQTRNEIKFVSDAIILFYWSFILLKINSDHTFFPCCKVHVLRFDGYKVLKW